MPTSPQLINSHAIVIGGSIAGLLAARVLSDHFEQVTIIERDRLPDEPARRSGAPQARHFHQLLARGRAVMEELLPGLSDELNANGAQLVDSTQALVWLTPAGWAQRYPSGLHVLGASRDLLEWGIRRRVLALPNVRVLMQTDVMALQTDPSNGHVNGVLIRSRQPGHNAETLFADLVVDASGRSSKLPQWLQALGYKAPEETLVDAHMGYASRFYHIPADFQGDWQAVYIQAAPPRTPTLRHHDPGRRQPLVGEPEWGRGRRAPH